MEFSEVIYNRYSVRNYLEKSVDKEIILKLIDVAIQAPSGMNSQPWTFSVIQNREAVRQVSDQAKIHLLSLVDKEPLWRKFLNVLNNPNYNMFYDAPVLVTIYAIPGDTSEIDCCLAAQNMMLAAYDMGLGSCWIGQAQPHLDQDDIKEQLRIPKECSAVAPIIIGYPAGKIINTQRHKPYVAFNS